MSASASAYASQVETVRRIDAQQADGNVHMVATSTSTSWFTRGLRLTLSVGYMAVISAGLAAMTRQPFWVVYATVMGTSMVVFVAGLTLAVRWAISDVSGPRFGVATILFLMFLVAVYLGIVRLAVASQYDQSETLGWSIWMNVGIGVTILLVSSVPFVLMIGELLLQFAVWIVHRPWFRTLIVRVRRSDR